MSRQRRHSLHQKVANSPCAQKGNWTRREEEKLNLVSPLRLPPAPSVDQLLSLRMRPHV